MPEGDYTETTGLPDQQGYEKIESFRGVGVRVFYWRNGMWVAVSGQAEVEARLRQEVDALRTGQVITSLVDEQNALLDPHEVIDKHQVREQLQRADEIDYKIKDLRERNLTRRVLSDERLKAMRGNRVMFFQEERTAFDKFENYPSLDLGDERASFNNEYNNIRSGLTLVVFKAGESRFVIEGEKRLPPVMLATALVMATYEMHPDDFAQLTVSPHHIIEAARLLQTNDGFSELITKLTEKVIGPFKRTTPIVDIAACQDKDNRGKLANLLGTAKVQLKGVVSGTGLI